MIALVTVLVLAVLLRLMWVGRGNRPSSPPRSHHHELDMRASRSV